jgi:hypothetical protein
MPGRRSKLLARDSSAVACCCELPGNFPPRWEAALELNKTGIYSLLALETSDLAHTNAEPE